MFTLNIDFIGEILPETSALWTELKMKVNQISFEIGAEITVISQTESAPAEILFDYNNEQYVVAWTQEAENEDYVFSHKIEHKVRTDFTIAIKRDDKVMVLAVYKIS